MTDHGTTATATAPDRDLAVCVETSPRRCFASALDWPGWCRSGRDVEAAVESLLAYAPRYALVVAAAGTPPLPDDPVPRVVEQATGGTTTAFGAPEVVAGSELAPLRPAEAERRARLVAAAWEILDEVLAGAPEQLRKGPRGGGRDRDAIADHVLGAEMAYARKIGLRIPRPAAGDRDALRTEREQIAGVLRGATSGEPLAPKGWPARYAARRIAWHVLDHAWEIQDRAT